MSSGCSGRPGRAATDLGQTGDMAHSPPVLVLANAAAGSAEDDAVQAALDTLRAEADVEVVVPEGPGSMQRALAGAAGRDLVVMGGDGSVHGVIGELYAAGTLDDVGVVGVVPLGTGNDLARALELPMDPADAARVALRGRPSPMDLLVDDTGGVVVNVVHVGVAAEATLHAEDVKGVMGTTAYAVGAVRAGATTEGWRLRVSVDGIVVADGSQPTLLVTVGLGSTVGGGTPIAPGASPTDGLAEVVVAAATGVADRLSFAMDLTRGEHTERDDVVVARGRSVTVEALDDECFAANADGEVSEPCSMRTWTVHSAAWRCRVPDAG